jgi:hypothetical protein
MPGGAACTKASDLPAVQSWIYNAQRLLKYTPLVSCRGGVYPRPKPGHLPERVGIKPTPTHGDALERYMHVMMSYVQDLRLSILASKLKKL